MRRGGQSRGCFFVQTSGISGRGGEFYLGVFNRTDCARLAHELGVAVLFVSQFSECVDYDTEDDVHEDNVDDDEASHVVEKSDVVHVPGFQVGLADHHIPDTA
jgi:hypothetical protein